MVMYAIDAGLLPHGPRNTIFVKSGTVISQSISRLEKRNEHRNRVAKAQNIQMRIKFLSQWLQSTLG